MCYPLLYYSLYYIIFFYDLAHQRVVAEPIDVDTQLLYSTTIFFNQDNKTAVMFSKNHVLTMNVAKTARRFRETTRSGQYW